MDSLSAYTNNSKNVCIFTTISILLVLIFIISPLNKFFIASFFGKVVALLILAYALYQNYTNTETLSKTSNIYLFKGEWSPLKTNILCGYIFSFFILLLFFSILKNMLL
jgi:hypothetical protein